SASYNWQYKVEGSGRWYNMPSWTQGKKEFDIIPNTFLGEDAINKKIQFRIKSCQGYISDKRIYYDLRKSAPKIIRKSISQPKCYDSKGSVRLYFNRQLVSGDKISCVLYDKTKPAGGSADDTYYIPLFNENNITRFEEENGNYFIEIDGLTPSDNYLFEMIGFGVDKEYTDEDGNTIPTEDSKYEGFPYYTDGTAHSINISIDRPTPVDFSIDHHTDVICNGESN